MPEGVLLPPASAEQLQADSECETRAASSTQHFRTPSRAWVPR